MTWSLFDFTIQCLWSYFGLRKIANYLFLGWNYWSNKMTMSLQNKPMRNWVAFNTCLKANLILYCKLQLNNVISFLAGKRRAEVTTDIADKGKQRFFVINPHLPLPLPLSHFRMSGSWEKNENQILFGLKLIQKNNSGAPAARRATKRSPITIGTGSHACIEIETHATLFSW